MPHLRVEDSYYVAAALYWYDYSLTFGSEVRYIWRAKGKLSVVSCLFYIIRYSAMAHSLCVVLQSNQWTRKENTETEALVETQFALELAILACGAVFSGIRAYALSEKRRLLLILIWLLISLNPALYAYSFFRTKTKFYQDLSRSVESMVASRISAMLSEGLVLFICWLNLRWHRSPNAQIVYQNGAPSLARAVGLFLLNFACIIVCNLPAQRTQVRPASMLCAPWLESYYSCLSGQACSQDYTRSANLFSVWIALFVSILTARFILHLRESTDEADVTMSMSGILGGMPSVVLTSDHDTQAS
ncbi:hypothetical protein WOLCODRAFT_25117 [Wolfiporia cocos MD-104 SS10]|uniref:DUF6533 domain-containing protein n=1 Tax=Wolfiporia cocos (strain MD-104) TaxID=742152 RepID=A0A2H3JKM2_WOLCO|nr:hypothetical protein WOLCODRAFT_25117 [Wolfiporia cocos MD-104 SS10]